MTSDSNQLLHVTLHLAGQVCSQANADRPADLHVLTRTDGEWVMVEFTCDCPPGKQSWQLLDGDAAEKYAGLSLSACRRIVKEHGGRIFFQSSSEGIFGFLVQLPATVKSSVQSPSGREIAGLRAAATQSS